LKPAALEGALDEDRRPPWVVNLRMVVEKVAAEFGGEEGRVVEELVVEELVVVELFVV
jgi:hypothetical protein